MGGERIGEEWNRWDDVGVGGLNDCKLIGVIVYFNRRTVDTRSLEGAGD